MKGVRYLARAFAIKAEQIVNKKTVSAFGWQLIFNEEFEGEGFRQIHYLGLKLTRKQARLLKKSPFLSLDLLTGRTDQYQYVVASNVTLEDSKDNKTRIKVARKEWKGEEGLKTYLTN